MKKGQGDIVHHVGIIQHLDADLFWGKKPDMDIAYIICVPLVIATMGASIY